MKRSLRRLLALVAVSISGEAMSVTLTPLVDPPAPVGATITWAADVSDASDGTLWYRFRVRPFGESYQVIRDYGPSAYLDWTAAEHEGIYEMEVSVRNHDTGETQVVSAIYRISSRVDDVPAVNPTANPLVFLFSAPACPEGSRMRVQFQSPAGPVRNTPFKPCVSGLSMNFYIAGLAANGQYTARHVLDTGSQFITGPDVSFATGDSGAPPALFTQTVIQQPTAQASSGILLGSSFVAPAATDMAGNLLWYVSNGISFVTSADPGGAFWGIVERSHSDPSMQTIRKFDLAGMTLLETNAARVNEQLAALGRRTISGFHHDVKTLPDGRVVALASVEQLLTDVQGEGEVDVLGDMIIVFDRNLNVVWTWDTFDHLDVKRAAVLHEVCTSEGGGCPPYYLASNANDWTHGNSVQQTPDGQLLYSSRHQDWVIKIGYNSGEGDGHVIWRLGKDGDFQFDSGDPYPWFSHQHDANVSFSDPTTMLVFDNGNTRVSINGEANSRGQVIRIDEQNRVARLIVNADLEVYSLALGTAQRLPNGNYNFDAGYVLDSTSAAGSMAYVKELDPAGTVAYAAKATTILYRWFRMSDLYTPN